MATKSKGLALTSRPKESRGACTAMQVPSVFRLHGAGVPSWPAAHTRHLQRKLPGSSLLCTSLESEQYCTTSLARTWLATHRYDSIAVIRPSTVALAATRDPTQRPYNITKHHRRTISFFKSAMRMILHSIAKYRNRTAKCIARHRHKSVMHEQRLISSIKQPPRSLKRL